MSKDTFYEQQFKSKCCKKTTKQYVWLSLIDEQVCSCNKKGKLVPIFDDTEEAFTVINGKHKKGRTPKERYERRTKHFRKEILPTLGGDDRKHFEKKLGKPL